MPTSLVLLQIDVIATYVASKEMKDDEHFWCMAGTKEYP